MKRVALTGGIATGKSHIRARFESLGVPMIDADLLARTAVAPGSPGLAAIASAFGPEALDAAGRLDRPKMAARVFSDPDARRALEGIVHPVVRAAMDAWFATLPEPTPVAIADIPLLYETGLAGEFAAVIVAACDPETQVRRIMRRDGLDDSAARARLAAQLPIAGKAARADFVIDTNGSIERTDEQVEAVWRKLAGGW